MPDTVKLEMAQAASFLVENSEFCKWSMIGSIKLASITDLKMVILSVRREIKTHLDLTLISGGDVRQEPDGLLINFVFSMAQQSAEEVQCTTIEHHL